MRSARKGLTVNQKLAILWGGLLVVAVGLHLSGRSAVYDPPEPTSSKLFEGLEVASIATLVIEGPTQSATLQRGRDDRWVVASENSYPADSNAVGRVLDEIAGLPSGRIASAHPTPQQLARYELDETRRVHVRALASDGAPLAEFSIGKTAEDFRSSFVQKVGEEAVRRIYKVLRSTFGESKYHSWRDRTILDVSVKEIVAFRMEGSQGVVELVRDQGSASGGSGADALGARDSGAGAPAPSEQGTDPSGAPAAETWRLVSPLEGVADDILVERLKSRITPLQAESWPDEEQPLSAWQLDPPRLRVTVRLESGAENVLLVGARRADGNVYVKMADAPTVFIVPEWRVSEFDRPARAYLSGGPRK
ncbi:MAG: DUF4340 domain-containing protein [Planctomycetota bacterium]